MILHGASISPFVRKVVVFAHEKGLALDCRPMGIGPKPPEFLAISPFGKIPAFEDGDFALADSTAICHYLEAKSPETKLIPTEARALGRTIWFEEIADTIIVGQLGPIFSQRVVAPLVGRPQDLALADKLEAEALPPIAAYLESQISECGFLVEDRLTLADIAVASPLANMVYANVDLTAYPKLVAWMAAIHARPSFVAALAMDAALMKGRG